jgi:hypothetical protein
MSLIKRLIVLVTVSLTAVLGACASAPPSAIADTPGPASVRLIISLDFGKTILDDKIIDIDQKSNAMSVLQQAAQVKTSYGGGFVSGINGLCSEYSVTVSNKRLVLLCQRTYSEYRRSGISAE